MALEANGKFVRVHPCALEANHGKPWRLSMVPSRLTIVKEACSGAMKALGYGVSILSHD